MSRIGFVRLAVVVAGLVAVAVSARADAFLVTVNTSALAASTQTVAFGFTDNDGSVDNGVILSTFNFGGGNALAGTQDCTLGGFLSGIGCGGNLASSVILNDSDFEAFFSQQFVAGSSLSFILDTSNNFAGGIPDGLAMYLCDQAFSLCYSNDPATLSLFVLSLDGTSGNFASFGSSDPLISLSITPAPALGPPGGGGTTPTPEPSSFLMLASGLIALVGAASLKTLVS